MRFSTKLTILFSGVVLFISAVIAFIVYTSNISTLEDHIKDRLRNQAFHTIDKIDRMLFERQADIKVLAADPVIASENSTSKQRTKRLLEFQDNYKEYSSLSFFDLNRRRIADTKGLDIGKQHSLSGYWLELSEGKGSVCDISESESLKRQEFHFASVVKGRKGSPSGVIVARMSLENIYDIAGKAVGIYNIKKDFRVELVDKNGLVIYSNTEPEKMLKAVSPEWDFIKKPISAGLINSAVRHTHPGEKGEEKILVFAREQGYQDFKGEGWTLIIEVSSAVINAPANKLRSRLIIILFLISAAAFSLVLFLSRSVSKTIEKLGIAADEIGKGNLETRVEIKSDDETGMLGAAFNKMVADLKEYRDKLLAHTNELENKVEKRTSRLRDINEHLEELVELRTVQLKESRERLRSVSLHLEAVREDERANVARDLHDELGQALTALKMDASWLFSRLQDRRLSEKANVMIHAIDTTIKTVKQMCSDLRPPILDYFGLAAAIEWQVKEFEQKTGVSCDFGDGAGITLGKEKAIMVFRIFQEALTNIARHTEATRVTISLTAENGRGTLTVWDNGKGITDAQLSDTGSLGLTGMKERAYLLGGGIDVTGNQEQGTTVRLTFPVDKETEK